MIKKYILLSFRNCFPIVLLSLYFFSCSSSEITFFNVGEGHCTLVHQEGCDPLLIDAGSRRNPLQEKNLQEKEYPDAVKGKRTVEALTDAIVNYWGNKQPYNLNVILTHGDKDHIEYVRFILQKLQEKQPEFTCCALLGGKKEHYSDVFLSSLRKHLELRLPKIEEDQLYYSAGFPGLFQGTQQLGFLSSSGCITHLYCPTGKSGSRSKIKNGWSIITRVELSNPANPQKCFSALLPGDADEEVQKAFLRELGSGSDSVKSDILLYPHHGAQPLIPRWIQAIDPSTVVISAGRVGGKASHPKAEAISSLFWQYSLQPTTASVRPTPKQYRSERIWRNVASHKIIYYGNNMKSRQAIQNKLPITQDNKFYFTNDSWYADLGPQDGWGCALVNFPIYTLYSSGTLQFNFSNSWKPPYSMQEIDVMQQVDAPSKTDLRIRWVNDNFMDDKIGDFKLLHLLSNKAKETVVDFLQVPDFSKVHSWLLQDGGVSDRKAKILFLSFVIIPKVERSTETEILAFLNKNIADLLNFFLDKTYRLDFSNPQDVTFFDQVINLLFADTWHYDDIDLVIPLEERMFLFDAFFMGPHLQEREARMDLFYLYYTIYSAIKDSYQITKKGLRDIVQKLRDLPFRKATDKNFDQNGVEVRLDQIIDIYNECNELKLSLDGLVPLLLLINRHNLTEGAVETLGEVLSNLPSSFNIPVYKVVDHLIPLLPKLDVVEDFEPIAQLFDNRLVKNRTTNHLEILTRCINELYQSYT